MFDCFFFLDSPPGVFLSRISWRRGRSSRSYERPLASTIAGHTYRHTYIVIYEVYIYQSCRKFMTSHLNIPCGHLNIPSKHPLHLRSDYNITRFYDFPIRVCVFCLSSFISFNYFLFFNLFFSLRFFCSYIITAGAGGETGTGPTGDDRARGAAPAEDRAGAGEDGDGGEDPGRAEEPRPPPTAGTLSFAACDHWWVVSREEWG